MERIPILFLIDVLYTARGGAEGVLRKMIVHLPRDRYECFIATFATHAERVAADQYPCPVYRLPIERTYDWRALRMGSRLAGLIRARRIQITHTFFPTADLFGGAIARLSGCPIVISSRRDMGFQRSAAQKLAYRAAGGWLFDQVHAVAENVRRWHIQQDRLDPQNVFTVYNGIDLSEIDAASEGRHLLPPELSGNEPLVVCVANIRPVKGIDNLVRTAAIVCRDTPSARFLVLGAIQDESYMRQVTELARTLGVDRKLIFAGASDVVLPILKAAQVFYMPSRSEGLCNAILEAMACEVPCVATEVGGNPELIRNEWNGYLTPVGDYESAGRRILELLGDAVAARAMGRAGRRIIESQFSLKAMIEKLTGLYEGLLERRAHAGRLKSRHASSGLCRASLRSQ